MAAVSRTPSSVLAITKNNAGLHATDSIKVIFWCQINPGTSEPARPTALQWPFLESDTYSFLIDICQKYWHFDLLASYGPGRRCVVLGTAVWTIGFKKMVIGEPEKKISKKISFVSLLDCTATQFPMTRMHMDNSLFSHFTDFLLEISKI